MSYFSELVIDVLEMYLRGFSKWEICKQNGITSEEFTEIVEDYLTT